MAKFRFRNIQTTSATTIATPAIQWLFALPFSKGSQI